MGEGERESVFLCIQTATHSELNAQAKENKLNLLRRLHAHLQTQAVAAAGTTGEDRGGKGPGKGVEQRRRRASEMQRRKEGVEDERRRRDEWKKRVVTAISKLSDDAFDKRFPGICVCVWYI